jgi:hypothetical protein
MNLPLAGNPVAGHITGLEAARALPGRCFALAV